MFSLNNKQTLYPNNWFFFLTNNFEFKHIITDNSNFFYLYKKPKLVIKQLTIKKNLIAQITSVTKRRLKIKYNNYYFYFYFKYFNLFNHFSKYTKIIKILKNKKIQKYTYEHKFYIRNLHKLLKTSFSLTGKLLSNYNWDFVNKKKWNRRKPSTSLKLNLNFSKLIVSNRFLNDFDIKKFYFNNFFYFNKIKITYNQLKYFCKLDVFKIKPNTVNWRLAKPYLFLNPAVRRDFSNTLVIDLFKYHQRVFSFFRRSGVKTVFSKNIVDSRFCAYDSKKPFHKQTNNFFVAEKIVNFFFLSFRNVSCSLTLKKKPIFFKNLNYKSFLDTRLALLNENFDNFKNIKHHFNNRFTSLTWLFKTLKNFKNLKNLSHSLRFKSYRNPVYKLKLKKLLFLLNGEKPVSSLNFSFFNKSKKIKLLKKPFVFSNLNLFSLASTLKNLNKPHGVKITKVLKKLLNFKISTNFKVPYFVNNFEMPFVLSQYSFVYLSNNIRSLINKSASLAKFKKNNFSFLLGNEIHKFIIKRYLKTQNLNFSYDRNNATYGLSFYDEVKTLAQNSSFADTTTSFSFQSLLKTTHTSMHSFDLTKNWYNLNVNLNYWENMHKTSTNFNIKRVKFKPGYMNLWRSARTVLQKIFNTKFRYQHKLTKYVAKLTKFIKFKIFLFNEMRLNNIILKSRIIPDKAYTDFFIKKGLVYLNGSNCYNPDYVLHVGDFLQLIVHVKYYIVFKWFLNWSLKKKIKLKLKTKKKNSPARFNDEKTKSFLLPDWILANKNITDDISKFLEVDYFTLSIIILYEPFLLSEFNIHSLIASKHNIINLYNWKYIT